MKRNFVVLCLTPDECEAIGIALKDIIDINKQIIDNTSDNEPFDYFLQKQTVILVDVLKRFE